MLVTVKFRLDHTWDGYENIDKELFLDDMIDKNPDEIIYYINLLLKDIEYIRIELPDEPNEAQLANIEMIKIYYRNNNRVKIKMTNSKKKKVIEQTKEQNKELEPFLFLLDHNLDKYEKLSMYINIKEGYDCTNSSEVKEILEDLT